MKKPLIPFGTFPSHWGVKGKTREIMKAEYELDGYDLECELCRINYTDVEYQRKKLEIDYAHGKISSYEYDLGMAIIDHKDKPNDREMAIANIDLKHGKLSQKQFDYISLDLSEMDETTRSINTLQLKHKHEGLSEQEMLKQIATLKGESWSNIRIIPDKDDPRYGHFDVDCNDLFIEELQKAGYLSPDKDEVLELYITDFCKSISMSSVKATMDLMDEIKKQNVKAYSVGDTDDE